MCVSGLLWVCCRRAKQNKERQNLHAVGLHLLAEARALGLGLGGEERVEDVDAPLGEHDHDELGHGVLGGLGGEDPYAVGVLVDVKVDAGQVLQGALVVLALEAEVALDEDGDGRALPAHPPADPGDVLGHRVELPAGVCATSQQSHS